MLIIREFESHQRSILDISPVIQFEVDNGTINKYLIEYAFPSTKCSVYGCVDGKKSELVKSTKRHRFKRFRC